MTSARTFFSSTTPKHPLPEATIATAAAPDAQPPSPPTPTTAPQPMLTPGRDASPAVLPAATPPSALADSQQLDTPAAALGPALPPGTDTSTLETIPVPVLTPSSVVTEEGLADLSARDGGYILGRPMDAIETLLIGVHDVTGLPWWASIAVATICGRLVLFPLQVFQSRATARLTLAKPQMDELGERMRAQYRKNTPHSLKEAEKTKSQLERVMIEYDVKPWRTFAAAVGVIPIWISFFFAVRKMMYVEPIAKLGLTEGGALWFPDLTQKDPYYVMPVCMGASIYVMVQLGDAGQAGMKLDSSVATARSMMKYGGLLIAPLTAHFEAGVFIYWLTANVAAITQTLLLRRPAIRAAVGMPPVPRAVESNVAAPSSGVSLPFSLPRLPWSAEKSAKVVQREPRVMDRAKLNVTRKPRGTRKK